MTCSIDEYWDGTSCAACTEGSFSAGGNATTTSCTSCAANEYWDGSACVINQIKQALSQGSGPTIWYTTADASSVLKGSQGEVTSWKDSTGNGYDISAGSNDYAPAVETIATRPNHYVSAVRVGRVSGRSVNAYLRTALSFPALGLAEISQPFTVMAVLKINGINHIDYLMDGYVADTHAIAVDYPENIFPYPTTESYPRWRGSQSENAQLTGNCGFSDVNAWGVHEWVFSSTAGEAAIYKADGSAPCIETTDSLLNTESLKGLTIGEWGNLGNIWATADVSYREFLIFSGTLTREESARYREYLSHIAT